MTILVTLEKPSTTRSKFSIKREIDLLSIASLATSVIVLSFGAGILFHFAHVVLFPPLFIVAYAEDYGYGTSYMRFIAGMNYANTAATGVTAVVDREFLEFSLASKVYHQEWRYFTNIDTERYRVKVL